MSDEKALTVFEDFKIRRKCVSYKWGRLSTELLWFVLPVFISGCHFGSAAQPILSSTPVPNSQFKIQLVGPNTSGTFGYYVMTTSGVKYNYRSLDRFRPGQTTSAKLDSVGLDTYRIEWADESARAFAIIDFKNGHYVEDSNPTNPKNQPMERRKKR